MLLAIAVLAAGCASNEGAKDAGSSEAGQTFSDQRAQTTSSPAEELHRIMMRPMQNMNMSGNVDKDFAMMMAEHHQQAIDMAQVEVEHGQNAELKAMAQKMIDAQAAERERLAQFAESLPNEATAQDASQRMHAVMMRPMPEHNMSGNVDKDFAAMMAQHHDQAIQMASIEVEHGQNAELKQMAQKMIDDQKKERERLLELAR